MTFKVRELLNHIHLCIYRFDFKCNERLGKRVRWTVEAGRGQQARQQLIETSITRDTTTVIAAEILLATAKASITVPRERSSLKQEAVDVQSSGPSGAFSLSSESSFRYLVVAAIQSEYLQPTCNSASRLVKPILWWYT